VKRLLAFLLTLCLLAGCGPQLEKYPRVDPASREIEPQILTIDIPREADQSTLDAVSQLAAALLELSGGAVTLEVIPSDHPARALHGGATHMALLENSDLIEADPSMAFLDWPFFLRDAGQWLTVMGAEDGVVRGSASLGDALGGEVIGLWYGGRTVVLCRASFYEEIGFSGSTLGVLDGRGGAGFFQGVGEDLGARTLIAGDREELLGLFERREIKYMEYPLEELDPEALPETLKYLEDTSHRVEGTWLVLGKDAVDEETARIVRAAAASVPQSVLDARARAEEELFRQLGELGVEVKKGSYADLRRASREYFRKNGRELGCGERTLGRLVEIVS